jgi:Flp pilus assembly pilin Flp
VEYILLVGLISVVAMTSVKALGTTASSQFANAAAQLSDTAVTPASSQSASDGSGDTGTTVPTTPATTTPATTAPTTTTSTTTTTTVPPTTLPPVATKGSTELTTPTVSSFGSYWWATSQLVVTDNLGVALSGAHVTLTVKSYTRQSNGTYAWVTTTQTLTTDSDGSVSYYVGIYNNNSSTGAVTKATVAVSAVTLPNGLSWDGDPSTITVNSP